MLDFTTGDVQRVSPGTGKTTCAWLHPDGNQVLFASTQDDPEAVSKQQAELKLREEGAERRYSWDYDQTYDLYRYDLTTKRYHRLTNSQGYDAEASYSPDGRHIVFASNRQAYTGTLTETQKERFEQDPSIMMDLYLMKADGTDVVQLTNELGYDGGPFFSPDGRRIGWRRFSPDGATAEVMTMAVDGTDPKQLTRLGALSWAPFYHPSGQYLIFATNFR